MITQAEIETYREEVQNAFDTLSIAYETFRKVDLWVAEDPIFTALKTALSDVGSFRAGLVRDYSELFVGWRVDDVYADEFKITYDEISFRTKMEIALESIASAQNYFTATVEEDKSQKRVLDEIKTTKRISASGGALKISLTSECNAMGLGVGDYVEVTLRRAPGRK